MIIIGIFVGIGIYLGIRFGEDWDMKVMISMFAVMIFGLMGLAIAAGVGSTYEKTYECTKTTNIYAMKDGSGLHGSFFLGCGTIDDVQYYFYYEKIQADMYKQGKIPVKDVYIIEQDSCTSPRIEYHRRTYVDDNAILWGNPLNSSIQKYTFRKVALDKDMILI